MAALVNGPEGDALDWGSINWPRVEGEVRHLRQRIFTASQAGHLKKGPQFAEVDAPVTRQRAYERAASDRTQRWSQDGRR